MGIAVPVPPTLDDLDPIQVGPVGILDRTDQKARRLLRRRGSQVAAHRYALGVARGGQVGPVRVRRLEVETAEEPDDHPRAGGGIDLPATHRREDGFAGVLPRPDGGVTAGGVVPTREGSIGIGFDHGVLAPPVVFVGGCQTGVGVGGADHAELEGIDAKARLHLEPHHERGACVFVALTFGEIRGPFLGGQVVGSLAPRPCLEIGKLVIGRQDRVRLRIALDLSHLVDRLPPLAGARVLDVDGVAVEVHGQEHPAVREVAVMRDGEHLAARLALVAVEVRPEILDIPAVLDRER